MTRAGRRDWTQAVLVALLCLPLAVLAFDFAREIRQPGVAFGPDPAETIVRYLGEWAIRMLLAALAVSPVARALGRPRLIRYRRTFGLTAFAYAVAHFAGYFVLLAGLDANIFLADFRDRPYITVGLGALVLLVPLAATSTRGWIRRLGKRWRKLHRLVYPAAALGVLHFYWKVRADTFWPLLAALSLAVLLAARIGGRRARSAGGRAV